MPSNEVICSGMIDRIGLETKPKLCNRKRKARRGFSYCHKIGLEKIAQLLMHEKKE
jgi:acetate kinase